MKIVISQRPVFKPLVALVLAAGLLLGVPPFIPLPGFSGDFEMGMRGYNQGEYAVAIQYFRSALMRDGNNPHIRYYLADALARADRLAEAQTEYQLILANAPDSQAAKLSRAGLARLRGYLVASYETGLRTQKDVSARVGLDRVTGIPSDGENYIEVITDEGRLVRWSLKKMPLKMYIERSPQGNRNFSPSFIAQVTKGMDVWVRVLGNQISYTQVNTPEEADIRVLWTNGIDTTGNIGESGTTYTAGITTPYIMNNELRTMTVKIATFDVEGKPQNADNIHAVAIHELGHALGLLGHSDDKDDIMFAQNQQIVEPSKRDRNTIVLLYSKVPGVTNMPHDMIDKEGEDGDDLATKIEDETKRLEEELENSGTVLNHLNVATAYMRKAKQLKSTDRKAANEWFEKAIAVVNDAIKLEPKNHNSYLKLCFIHQAMDSHNEALIDADTAIRLAPKDPDAHLQRAWILGGMGRSGEANGSLDQYIALDPSMTNSPDVKNTRDRIAQHAKN